MRVWQAEDGWSSISDVLPRAYYCCFHRWWFPGEVDDRSYCFREICSRRIDLDERISHPIDGHVDRRTPTTNDQIETERVGREQMSSMDASTNWMEWDVRYRQRRVRLSDVHSTSKWAEEAIRLYWFARWLSAVPTVCLENERHGEKPTCLDTLNRKIDSHTFLTQEWERQFWCYQHLLFLSFSLSLSHSLSLFSWTEACVATDKQHEWYLFWLRIDKIQLGVEFYLFLRPKMKLCP